MFFVAITNLFLFIRCMPFFSMSSGDSAPSTSFEKLARAFNRPKLLQFLRLPTNCPRVEDFEGLRSFSTDVQSALCIHKSHVPQLGEVAGGVCSGAKFWRHGRISVGVPCCASNVSAETGFCPHCEKVWMTGFDDEGFIELEKSKMPDTFEFYEPGKAGVLWNAPPLVHAEELFSEKIQEVKDKVLGTSHELGRDWPDASFKEVASSLLVGSGILHDDADRSRNPYKRTLENQVTIGQYVSDLVGQWLQIRAFVDLEDLKGHVDDL